MPKTYKYRKTFTYDGHRYVVYGDTLEEIYEKKANKLRDLKEGKVLVSGSMLVKDWVPLCIDTYKPNQSEEEKESYQRRARKYITDELGTMRLKDVTPLQCQRIISDQAGMSRSHITKVAQTMFFVFDKAQRNHYIFENPAADLVIPKGYEGHRRSLTEKERDAFLQIEHDYEPFLLFSLMLYCGCRPKEAMHIVRDDLQIVEGVPMFHIRGTKTATSDRFVPVPDEILDRVRRADKPGDIVLTVAGTVFNKQSYRRLTERLRREMNIAMGCEMYRNALLPPYPLSEDFVPYMFRHTYCTDLQKAGVDVRVAQRLMGHASIEITANIYTHVDQFELAKAAHLLDAYRHQGYHTGYHT